MTLPAATGTSLPTLTLPAAGTATHTPSPAPSATPPFATPTKLAADNPLATFCARHPPVAPNDNWVEMINALKLPTDLSPAAQSQLAQPVTFHPTCNFYKDNNPRAIILHYTGGSLIGAVATFQLPHNTSAHYVIGRDGTVVQMVPEGLGAYHVTCYGYRSYCLPSCPICDLNGKTVEPATQSIGIELVNQGHVDPATFHGSLYEDYQQAFGYRYWEDFPLAQIAALKVLVADIRARWGIPWEMVMGHSRIDPKDDPGPALNLFWARDGNPPRPPIFDTNTP